MKLVSTGVAREVILVGPWAVKIPKLRYGWRNFLQGLIANMNEATWGRSGYEGLCPVLFTLPGGWLLIQRRATPLTCAEWCSLDQESFLDRGDYLIPAEWKRDSFGRINERIVAVDYGN